MGLTLALVEQLAETLNSSGAVYCHWKSNFSLAQALAGETDLDLLVERGSMPRTQAILADLGFKTAAVRGEPATPGVSHWYGLDPNTGQLVHVHLFGQVLTGESLVKSHLLPFESMLLENTDVIGPMRVAARPAELVVFIVRTFIKYGSLPDVVLLSRNAEDIRAELHWLKAGDDLSEALLLLREYCPEIDEQLFLRCIETLEGHSSLGAKVLLARRVRRRLSTYAQRTALRRGMAYVRVLWGWGWRRLGGNRKNKELCAGGRVIAFVGPEATGKSTLISASGSWLGQAFAARTVHAGKPPSSLITLPMNVAVPLARNLLPRLRTSQLEGHASATENQTHSRTQINGLPALIYAFRAVVLAWDRRQLLWSARRSAANGEIVLCDRYPSDAVGVMDSPRLREDRTKNGMIAATFNWLASVERRLYEQIPPPDLALRLKVSLETAKQRNRERIKKGKETDAYVESRHRSSREWHRSGTDNVQDIDTEQPLTETVLEVKKAIWESL